LPDAASTRLARLRGESVRLNVTVPASVLLGISNAPGELAGYGPITAETARQLVPGSTMRRILTDPLDGRLLDVGTTIYRPPAGLARHVQLRDGHAYKHLLARCPPRPDGRQPGITQISRGVFRWILPTGHEHTVRPQGLAPPLTEELRT
jgi:hypothetical protein